MTRSQNPGDLSGFGSGRCFRRVRTGDAIVSGPVMLIGSYRSFPCVAPECRERKFSGAKAGHAASSSAS